MESVLFNDLLGYLRIHQEDNKIEYREKPVKITKGLATDKYVFTLNNAPEHLTQPLVVRIFRKTMRNGYAEGEAQVQNAVHDLGYPTPRVFFACSDKSVVGGEFKIVDWFITVVPFSIPSNGVQSTRIVSFFEKFEESKVSGLDFKYGALKFSHTLLFFHCHWK